ncbi:MAG: DUF1569 domain-containing protein [Planctomycetia bacterium]|nr:DUF1569 domain-containing protein [Planctomycetia bacterium]
MSTTAAARRPVHYETIDDFLADVDHLAGQKFHTVGHWSFPEILDHLAKTVTASVDGYGFKAPWFARVLIAPFVKNAFITKTMRAGFKLPKSARSLLPEPGLSLSDAVDRLKRAIERYKRAPNRAPHPFVGALASQEYDSLHLRHSELHMSFVVPDETG